MFGWLRPHHDVELYFVGDSHIRMFKAAGHMGLLRQPALFLEIAGATASGLENPNSNTQALAQILGVLVPRRPNTLPVVHLGEVDCGFVIWWRASRYDEPVSALMDRAVRGYFELVDQLLAAGYPTVVVTSATLPTLRDGAIGGEVANKRSEVTASLAERTALTLQFNRALAAESARRSLPFVDVSATMLDPRTGVVADSFRHKKATDHHLNPRRAARIWSKALNRLPQVREPLGTTAK